MKIIHFADLHLGVESFGKIDPTTGFSTRLVDILKAFDELIDYVIGNDVDLVLFCGDTYKNRDPSQTQQREFAKRLKRLSEANIPVFLLVGNHDLPNAIGKATTVEIFETLAVKGIYVGSSFDVYKIPTKSGTIQVVALPWPKRSNLLTREDIKNLSIDDINRKIEEAMSTALLCTVEKIDDSIPVILAAHVSVSTAKQGSEKTMLVGRDPVLLLSNVALPIFDYIALGHIHKRQVLNENPPVIYSGSLERLDFSDENEDKGFYVVNIGKQDGSNKTDYRFQEINARRFVTITVTIENDDPNPMETILTRLESEKNNIKDAIVKLYLKLPRTAESLIRESEIYKALKESYYISISKEFKQESINVMGVERIEKLTPLEALKIYLESKKISEERIKILLEYGEKVIREMPDREG